MYINSIKEEKALVKAMRQLIQSRKKREQPYEFHGWVCKPTGGTNDIDDTDWALRDLLHHSHAIFGKQWHGIRSTEQSDVQLKQLIDFYESGGYQDHLDDLIRDTDFIALGDDRHLADLAYMIRSREVSLKDMYVVANRFGDEPFRDSSFYGVNVQAYMMELMQYGEARKCVCMK